MSNSLRRKWYKAKRESPASLRYSSVIQTSSTTRKVEFCPRRNDEELAISVDEVLDFCKWLNGPDYFDPICWDPKSQ